MFFEIIPLLLISVPIFYIIGLITFFRTIFGSKKNAPANYEPTTRRDVYLKKVIVELREIFQKTPDKKLSMLIKDYEEELGTYVTAPLPEVVEEKVVTTVKPIPKDSSSLWNNWYSNNSINLLLYIGAFFIVAAASIFVSFAWETIPGIVKELLLIFLTLAFFGSGLWFYSQPKIQNAGSTFIGIGALLIPICGSGWYNFVAKPLGESVGPVWLFTSLIAVCVYILLAKYLRQALYTYVASISTLSFSFSVINTFGLVTDFYILAAMLSSVLLLLIRISLPTHDKKDNQVFLQPLEISANIILPASLLYGFVLASATGRLFTMQSTLSVFLATGYYCLTYAYFKKSWAFAAAEVLSILSVVFLGNWLGQDTFTILSILSFLAVCYAGSVSLLTQSKRMEEANITAVMSSVLPIIVFLHAVGNSFDPWHLVVFSAIPTIIGLLLCYLLKRVEYIAFSSLFLAIGLFIFHTRVLFLEDAFPILGMTYEAIGVLLFMSIIRFKKSLSFLPTLTLSSIFFFFLAILCNGTHFGYQLFTTLIIAGILFTTSSIFSKLQCMYYANVVLTLSLWCALEFFNVSSTIRPLVFSLFYCCYYLASTMLQKSYQDIYRKSGLLGIFLTPVWYWFYIQSTSIFGANHLLEQYSLITSYIAVALFGLDAYEHRDEKIGYFASALGMGTYLWHIHFLGVSETQIYTLPLGLYFLTLSYLRKRSNDLNTSQMLSLTGMFFLLIPTLFQSFGDDSIRYSLLLLAEGMGLLGIGISMKDKLYMYGGVFSMVFAIISQTYQYLFSIPRWLVVGILGLLFLGFAITLLLKRKDEHTS